MNPEKSIPSAVLRGAKGLAILTVAKAGVLLAYKIGTGLVIARRPDGSWSAPSAILSVGLGWGAQVIHSIQLKCLFQIVLSFNFLKWLNFCYSICIQHKVGRMSMNFIIV